MVSAAPPIATRTDAAFLELACAPGDDRVDKLLDTLGFAMAGRHRSKPVTWWRNGEAHVVVNEAAGESDANRASALGLSARPVEAVAARARALLWPEVDSNRGTGEAMLPGIASPSGPARLRQRHPGARRPLAGRLRADERCRRGPLHRPRPRRHLGLAAAAQRGDGVLPDGLRLRAGGSRGVHGAPRSAAQHRVATGRGRRTHRAQRDRGIAADPAPRTASPRWRCAATTWPTRSPAYGRAECR